MTTPDSSPPSACLPLPITGPERCTRSVVLSRHPSACRRKLVFPSTGGFNDDDDDDNETPSLTIMLTSLFSCCSDQAFPYLLTLFSRSCRVLNLADRTQIIMIRKLMNPSSLVQRAPQHYLAASLPTKSLLGIAQTHGCFIQTTCVMYTP